jgi:hypothetical protein
VRARREERLLKSKSFVDEYFERMRLFERRREERLLKSKFFADKYFKLVRLFESAR